MDIIKSIDITAENYVEAWESLIERYNNRRRIIQDHVKQLVELPYITRENHVQLRNLLSNVLKHLRALKTLERPVDTWDDLDNTFHFVQALSGYKTRMGDKSHG